MNSNIFLMNGYGLYVWSAFIFTFLICFILFFKVKKSLNKVENDFKKEVKGSGKLQDLKDRRQFTSKKEIQRKQKERARYFQQVVSKEERTRVLSYQPSK